MSDITEKYLDAELDSTVRSVVRIVKVRHAPLVRRKALARLEHSEHLTAVSAIVGGSIVLNQHNKPVDSVLVWSMASGLDGVDAIICVRLRRDLHKVTLA